MEGCTVNMRLCVCVRRVEMRREIAFRADMRSAGTYLSGEDKQGDEEDEEGDRAHCLQVFQNAGPWSAQGRKRRRRRRS